LISNLDPLACTDVAGSPSLVLIVVFDVLDFDFARVPTVEDVACYYYEEAGRY